MSFHIHPARTPSEIRTTTKLVTAYAAALGLDLTYQDFATEISSMPGKYAPPGGDILLAIDDDSDEKSTRSSSSSELHGQCKCADQKDTDISSRVLGCVALRPLPSPPTSPSPLTSSSSSLCEVKRLYISPHARNRGVGRTLVSAIIRLARERGYTEMSLDTLRSMHGPIALYREAGFEEMEAYYETPVRDVTVFFRLEL